jgi:hypothetical protein
MACDGVAPTARMMCWDESTGGSVKVIGDEPKYVALARLGKSFFFTRQGSSLDAQRPTPMLHARPVQALLDQLRRAEVAVRCSVASGRWRRRR